MSARTLRLPVAIPRVSRVERDRVVVGICAGIGEALAVDATVVRLTFAFLAFASGAGIVAYLGAWALLPAPRTETPPRGRRIVGTVLLAWAAILALSGLGLADSLVGRSNECTYPPDVLDRPVVTAARIDPRELDLASERILSCSTRIRLTTSATFDELDMS